MKVNAFCLSFVAAFSKLLNAVTTFVMSMYPSVRPHGATRLSLDGFS